MVIKFSSHAMPFIGSCFYRNVSESDITKTINKVKKFPKKNKFYIKDSEKNYVIVAALVKGKINIITVITDMSRPIKFGNYEVLMVSWEGRITWSNL